MRSVSPALGLARLHLRSTLNLPSTSRAKQRAAVLFEIALRLAARLGFRVQRLRECRLAELARLPAGAEPNVLGQHWTDEWDEALSRYVERLPVDDRGARVSAAHLLGQTLDLLVAIEVSGERRKLGSYFTPVSVARRLMESTLQRVGASNLAIGSVCDPACGGGAFLIEAAEALRGFSQMSPEQAVSLLYGVDLSPLAIAVTELALWIYAGQDGCSPLRKQQFVVGDALLDAECSRSSLPSSSGRPFSFSEAFPTVFAGDGFDWIVGNPPWVAFQGRATQKISPQLRSYYRARYEAFSGYPTLHSLFVQRALEIAPRGAISLLLPSSLSDLEGYRAVRARLRKTHEPLSPLEEFGQDAFEGVVQPCFGLQALAQQVQPSTPVRAVEEDSLSSRPFVLAERQKSGAKITASPPSFLGRFSQAPTLRRETFGELGFQSNRAVVEQLFLRAEAPRDPFSLPLLEGRNVGEFVQRQARLFLHADEELLREKGCRLRSADAYRGVDFVVRQTAAYTIAAVHGGLAFRNSLIAGYSGDQFSALLLVGLLNSALYRAIHCSRQRDARQAAFPQVKVAHLRSLPAPPSNPTLFGVIESLSAEAERAGELTTEQRVKLDDAVCQLFSVTADQRAELHDYLTEVAPRALSARK